VGASVIQAAARLENIAKYLYKRNYSSVIARSEEDSFALLGTG